MKKKSNWYEYIVEGLWVLSFLATILWIADANDNPLIKGIKGAVYEPLTIVFTLFASFTTWIYPKIVPDKKKKTSKDTIPKRRKVLIVATGLVILFGLILYSLRGREPSKEITLNRKDSTQLECNFPEKFQKDTLYILITRFEDYINKTETTCFGRSLRDRIDVKANKNHIPIKICYTDKFSPQTVTDVKALQKKYNADLVLWGRLKNVLKDCSEGDFCFLSQPSDTLIKLVGGEIKVEQMDLKYEQKISPSNIEQGEFHVASLSFDHWLTAIYNIKIGRNNPDLYLIDNDLTQKEQAEQHKQRGDLFYNLSNPNRAIVDYNRAIELNQGYSEAFYYRGNIKSFLKDIEGSIMDFSKAIRLKPDYFHAYINRGSAKCNLKDFRGGISDYNIAVNLNPNYSDTYYNRGLAKSKLNDFKEAVIDFNKSIELNPTQSMAYFSRANIRSHLKDLKGAIRDYSILIELSPNYLYAYFARGNIKYDLKDLNGAMIDYGKEIELNPFFSGAYNNRGNTKSDLKDFKGAIIDYNKAINLKHDNLEAYNNRGNAKFDLKDFKGAIIDYNKAINLKLDYSEAYFNRGAAKAKLQDYESAIADYNKAIKLNPYLSNAYYNRGNAKKNYLRDFKNAITDYNKVIELNPRDSDAYYNRGIAKERLKDFKGAKADFDKFKLLKKR